MSNRERIESQIREILAAEGSAATLSEKLFSPAGLFNALAPTEADRRLVVWSPLSGRHRPGSGSCNWPKAPRSPRPLRKRRSHYRLAGIALSWNMSN